MNHSFAISILANRIRELQKVQREEEERSEFEMQSDMMFCENTIANCKYQISSLQDSINELRKDE